MYFNTTFDERIINYIKNKYLSTSNTNKRLKCIYNFLFFRISSRPYTEIEDDDKILTKILVNDKILLQYCERNKINI
jgi:hypothetical protein